jgi:hypothetical protein
MPRSGKFRWTSRNIAVPLLLSVVVHGLLFSALWFWPHRSQSPTLTIQSTRITLDTCILESPSSMLLSERELPTDLIGPAVDTALAPRLEEPSPPPTQKRASPIPVSQPVPISDGRTGNGTRNGNGKNGISDSRSLFPLPATASSVVYVLDRSVSMGIDRKLDLARRELIASLRHLPVSVHFQVIDYNDYAETLVIDGRRDLLPAEPMIVAKAVVLLQALDAAGNTNHLAALRSGLDLHPDVLFFLTDADDLKPEEVAFITRRNQRTVLHTIELTHRGAAQSDGPLARLARDNHGTYRLVSISASDSSGASEMGWRNPVAGAPGW